jgi:hypothetical protein
LFIYTLTRKGRVETVNYRTVKLPTGMEIPGFVKSEFGDFYKAMFDEQTRKEGGPVVFVEYAWDMNWCDPCAADPLSHEELAELGVFWLGESGNRPPLRRPPFPRPPAQPRIAPGGAIDVFVTRLHVRYDAQNFPDDLVFQQTGDRSNFQGRYVLRHPWDGNETCRASDQYRDSLPGRFDREAQMLASLTGWDISEIRNKMNLGAPPDSLRWWERLWEN